MTLDVRVRLATPSDAPALADLVQRAYLGVEGWSVIGGIRNDERINTIGVLEKMETSGVRIYAATDEDQKILGCCEIEHRRDRVYFGMFAVDPALQAAGLGRQILHHAEQQALELWGVRKMELTAVAQREALIAWYGRRGYTRTGETRPFPYDQIVTSHVLRDDLYFIVLEKQL